MTALLPALSLSNKLLEIGALAAFAALVGIALLSLLVFAQARELKRLREWAGRAPERAAELERRVAAEVALRAQRAVPRATPLSARPVAGQAAGAAVASAVDANQSPLPALQPLPAPTVTPLPAPVPGQPAFVPTAQTVAALGARARAEETAAPSVEEAAPPVVDAPPAPAMSEPAPPEVEPVVVAAAPATVAAVAAVASTVASQAVADPPLPPAPPRVPVPPAPAVVRETPPVPRAPVPSRPLPPPPSAPPRRTVGRTIGAGSDDAPRMPPAPKFLVEEARPSRKPLLLIAAGAVVVAALAAVLLSSGGGGGSPSAKTPATTARGHAGTHHSHSGSSAATGPAQIHVAVLNATETTGLAHALASSLRSSGYTQAQALSARPPSARSTSVVEYPGGHRAQAQRVAQSLSITETAPLEEAIGPLVEGASVVVIAGADKASAAAASGEASPAEASSGEATAGGGAG